MRTSDLEKQIGKALSAEFTANSELLGRWVLLAEVIGLDGARAVWMLSADEQEAWETLGLVRFADHAAGAAIVRGED